LPLGPWPFYHGKPGYYVVGDKTGTRHVPVYYRDAVRSDVLHGKVWFGPGTEGPPMHAHGGAMAAYLDELLGICCWAAGIPAVAAQLNTTFRAMLPIGTVAWARCEIERRGTRSVHLTSRLFVPGGEEFATATGVFVALNDAQQAAAKAETTRRGGRTV
jgi:hypothetical protein